VITQSTLLASILVSTFLASPWMRLALPQTNLDGVKKLLPYILSAMNPLVARSAQQN